MDKMELFIGFWFIFVSFSLIYTVYDIRTTPVSRVQKLGWILVVMYTGPFGLAFYLLTCRSPTINLHTLYTQATWKQAVNSEVHCLAGDATGIIFAAIILSYAMLPRSIEIIIEYLAGFICGWVLFQATMMRSMYPSYIDALKKTWFPEAASMNCVMFGMIPTMVLLGRAFPQSHDPSSLYFWFVMGFATLIGGLTAYPINAWLVSTGLKHGCMTIPSAKENKMNQHDSHALMQHPMKNITFRQQVIIVGTTFIVMLIASIISFYLHVTF